MRIAAALFHVSMLAALGTAAAGAAEAPAKCVAPGNWLRLEAGAPRPVAPGDLLADMARRDVVLLGEEHSEADQHRWQLQTLAALHAQNPRMVIGFEMFPRRAQPVLDRWVAGELTAEEFLAQSNWKEVWRYPPELYLPLFQFARINRIPMLALNVDAKLTSEIGRKGWDAIPPDAREGVSRPAPPSAAYRKYLFEVWREHASPAGGKGPEGGESNPAFRNFVDAQLTWDRALAQGLAQALSQGLTQGAARTLAVGIVGASHVRDGHGVPHQLRDLGVQKTGVLLTVESTASCASLTAGMADAVFALADERIAKPRPPRLGVRLEQTAAGVSLADISAGSLAERTGLKKGDIIAQLAGKPLAGIGDMVDAVNRQPEGTWLPILVKRGAQSIEIVVKFPAQ